MDLRTTQVEITVAGVESLQSEYAISNIEYTDKSYIRNKGRITFTEPPATGSAIVVKYSKSITMLQAQDRINLFYSPTTGMLGNDVSQLMDGIDYGGIEVKSFTFGSGTGWSSEPYYTTTWDTYDNTYEYTDDDMSNSRNNMLIYLLIASLSSESKKVDLTPDELAEAFLKKQLKIK